MLRCSDINEEIKKRLPQTYEILKESNFMVHQYVCKVILTGSRGLAGDFREDSDIDLSLLVDTRRIINGQNEEEILKAVLNTTLSTWKGKVELDTVVVFDISNCGLKCFDPERFEKRECGYAGIDCMGLYKLQKGFDGYVPMIGVDIQRINPMISVWEK